MSKRRNDIERYLRGELTPAEMHALEKEAMRDPFLAEALEGAEPNRENFLFDLNELRKSVYDRARSKKTRTISMSNWSVGIAASLLIVAASSVYLISIINQNAERKTLASKQETVQKPTEKQAVADSPSATTDTTVGTLNEPATRKAKAKAPGTGASGPVSGKTSGIALTEVAQDDPVQKTEEKEVVADLTEWPPAAKDSAAVGDIAEKSTDLASATRTEAAVRKAISASTGERIVRGKVISSEDGLAIPGVNVMVKGTSIGTVTDEEGAYEIAMDEKQKLVFSFIGMQSVEADSEDQGQVNVQMKPDLAQLSEVVVTGSGYSTVANNEHPTLHLAEPTGGRKAFKRYLEEKMNYPEQARKNRIEGKVTVQFTVEPNGQLNEFKIIKGIGYGCDDEVIRLIKEGPAWSPTKRNDQPVKDRVKVRLAFDIPD